MAEEAQQENEAGGEEETPKKKGKLLLILGLLVGLGGGGAAGAKFLAPMIGEKLADSGGEEGEVAEAGGEDGGDEEGEGGGGGGEDGEGEAAEDTSVLHTIDQIIVNPTGSQGRRFLVATIAFETPDDSFTETVTNRDLEIRDGLNRVLGMKTVNELTDYARREALVEEIRLSLDEILGEGSVTRVFLPQFVIQ